MVMNVSKVSRSVRIKTKVGQAVRVCSAAGIPKVCRSVAGSPGIPERRCHMLLQIRIGDAWQCRLAIIVELRCLFGLDLKGIVIGKFRIDIRIGMQ